MRHDRTLSKLTQLCSCFGLCLTVTLIGYGERMRADGPVELEVRHARCTVAQECSRLIQDVADIVAALPLRFGRRIVAPRGID
jgi:hypothetical protein